MVRNGSISVAISLRTLAGSKSGPEALLGFSLSRSFTTPSLVTSISGIDGNDVPSRDGMLLLSSLVHVDSYCQLRISICFILWFSMQSSIFFKGCYAAGVLSYRLNKRPKSLLFSFMLLFCVTFVYDMFHKVPNDWRLAFCSLAFVSR